jgi:PAS domain S-box-containing protein
MADNEIDILKRALHREREARKASEKILEAKSAELYYLNKELQASNEELVRLYGKTNSQLQGVFENIVDAYIIMDLWGNILKMNKPAIELLGFEDEYADVNLMKLVHPDEIDAVSGGFKKLMTDGSITDFTLKIVDLKKQEKIIHVNGSIVYENEVPVAAQGIIRDVTQELNYRRMIEDERKKFSRIIANMNLGLLEVDNDDIILMANQRFEEMSGYSRSELIGMSAQKLLLNSDDITVVVQENVKRKQGISNSYEIGAKTKNGEVRNWLISGAPNYDDNAQVVGSIGVIIDITDQKKLQKQKETLLLELEKSNNELQEYAHVVSHDLKSPLRSIYALVSWLKEDNKDKFDDTSLGNLGLIERTLEKMEQLITDILNYSSVGVSNNEFRNVDLNDVVKDIENLIHFPDSLDFVIKNKLPVVFGDRIKLQQLFQNLISNAIKFSDKENGLIEISAIELPEFYQISVRDNGMGIEEKYHKKIFEVFQSLNKTNTSSGIGLSIVKKVVKLHRGKVWIESTPGEGTVFHFTLKK